MAQLPAATPPALYTFGEPLQYDTIKNDPEWKRYNTRWESIGKTKNAEKWKALSQEFVDLVRSLGLLADARPAEAVSSLHREDIPHDPNAGDRPLDWVDLVMAGGGLRGMAHIGYIVFLEHAGIRFRAMAGTSAGSIAAILLAACRVSPAAQAGQDLLALMLEMPVSTFKDGDAAEAALWDVTTGIISHSWVNPWSWWHAARFPWVWASIKANGGVHPGTKFQTWLQEVLHNRYSVDTLGELKTKCCLDTLFPVSNATSLALSVPKGPGRVEGLAVAVTADVTTSTKAALTWTRPFRPGQSKLSMTHSELYWADPDSVSPALCVRASMSYPVFFRPFRVSDIPGAGQRVQAGSKWAEVGYPGPIPDKVTFQDGGLLSCFPISQFHIRRNQVPRCPTFGVNLSLGRRFQPTGNLTEILTADLNAAMNIEDYNFISKNPDYNFLTKSVDTGGLKTLDFDLSPLGKFVLFHNGMLAARQFLHGVPAVPASGTNLGAPAVAGFDWEGYKRYRAGQRNTDP